MAATGVFLKNHVICCHEVSKSDSEKKATAGTNSNGRQLRLKTLEDEDNITIGKEEEESGYQKIQFQSQNLMYN